MMNIWLGGSCPFLLAGRMRCLAPNYYRHFQGRCSRSRLVLVVFGGQSGCFGLMAGVYVTAVGYAGGRTPHPSYEEVCSGQTGHTEVVLVVFDPKKIGLGHLLQTFWQAHDPTQGYRQGNDRGTQYRSAIFASDKGQLDQIMQSAHSYQKALTAAGYGKITTEIALADEFYYAETYHQQYLHKVPHGYCGLQGTGVACSG